MAWITRTEADAADDFEFSLKTVEVIINAADKINALTKQRNELLAACKDIFALMDEGFLVRSTADDHEPDWAIKNVPFVMRLNQIRVAITAAEKINPDER